MLDAALTQEPRMARSILITGCSSGIGLHCARALRTEGWRVFATARKPDDVAALAAQGFEALQLDHRDEPGMGEAFKAVLSATGGTLDALFINGAYAQAGAVEDLSTGVLRAQFESNFFGWHALTLLAMPVMRAQGHGRIIFNSSILGRTPLAFRGAYASSKFALEGLVRCMQLELEGSGIHACLIEPGPVVSKIAPNGLPHFKANIPLETSPHREAYRAQLARMEGGGRADPGRATPEVVMTALRHALNAKTPRPAYAVTREARIGLILQRLMTQAAFQRLLRRWA
jgi:NAD(P)-dependent dehydrogenase (short-subunit alcohol dehydrogenase family)